MFAKLRNIVGFQKYIKSVVLIGHGSFCSVPVCKSQIYCFHQDKIKAHKIYEHVTLTL